MDNRPPRTGSVCTGYGGLDEAVRQVFGGTLAWASDVDPGACQIIAHRMPGVPNIGDLTKTDWTQVEPVDIFIGGYPCQPFSLAGQLKGTDDERHLWPFIAGALRVLRPRIAIFENVANHLRLGFDTVLCDLADLGFNAEWCVVRADEVDAPHQRRRLFILATASDAPSQGLQGPGVRGRAAERGAAAADTYSVGGDRDRARGGRRDEPAAHDLAAAHAAGVGEREPADETDAVAGGGDAREVPGRRGGTPAAHASRYGLNRHGELPAGRNAVRRGVRADADGRGTGPAADSARIGRGEGRPEPAGQQGRSHPALGRAQDWGEYAPAIARWEAATGRCAPRATDDRRRLAPEFVEWMMGLNAGHVTAVPGLTRTQQLKALGNGVVPQQAAAAIRLLATRAGVLA
ncbi:DNA cytosine methyltransferase [Streptomyces olivaceus]|uniref:DNA cytosine methyltransferase n=1 Tax=Streptomyces olivaceus TaxID=47716 RepID=UPI00362C89E2